MRVLGPRSVSLLALVLGGTLVLATLGARGNEAPDPAQEALRALVERGEALWTRKWGEALWARPFAEGAKASG